MVSKKVNSKVAATSSAKKPAALETIVQYILVIGGLIGLYCSFVITDDKFKLLQNPHFQPGCDLNPVVSCGSVLSSSQSHVFGFTNPFIGLAAFAALAAIGAAMLAGAKFRRWFWQGMYVGTILGLAFALWLLFESVYRIKALCPYCLTVDVVVITLFWYLTLYMFESKLLHLPRRFTKIFAFARRHHLDILVGTFVVIIAVILNHFWYYYGHLLS